MYFKILILGILSGLPLPLISSTLFVKLYESGVSLANIGYMSLTTIPYTIKFFWSPFLDSHKAPIFGAFFSKCKSWIVLSQVCITLLLLVLSATSNHQSLPALCVMCCLISFFSATQDVAIDSLRVKSVSPKQQGKASSILILGYRIAIIISGGGSLYIANYVSWQLTYFIMTAIFAIFSAINILCKTKEIDSKRTKNKISVKKWLFKFCYVPLKNFAVKNKSWGYIITLIFSFKLCDAFVGNISNVFFVSLGFTKPEIAIIFKVYGAIATITGAIIGGICVARYSISKCLLSAAFLQALSNLPFAIQALLPKSIAFLTINISVENLAGGFGSVIFVAYLSQICSKSFSATQYAILSSMTAVPRVFISSSAGLFAQSYGWYNMFVFSSILGIPSIILIYLVFRKDIAFTTSFKT